MQGEWGSRTQRLTFALQTLPQEAPEQGATVVAEGGDLVVVDPELVRHVDTEPLGAHLQGRQITGSKPNQSREGIYTGDLCHLQYYKRISQV